MLVRGHGSQGFAAGLVSGYAVNHADARSHCSSACPVQLGVRNQGTASAVPTLSLIEGGFSP